MTKGEMCKVLKANGIRKGDKDGSFVSLEHLKTYQIIKMYAELTENSK